MTEKTCLMNILEPQLALCACSCKRPVSNNKYMLNKHFHIVEPCVTNVALARAVLCFSHLPRQVQRVSESAGSCDWGTCSFDIVVECRDCPQKKPENKQTKT